MKNLKLGQTVVVPGGAIGEVTKIDAVEVTIDDNRCCYYRKELSELIALKYKIGQKLFYNNKKNSFILVEHIGHLGTLNMVTHCDDTGVITRHLSLDSNLFEKLTLEV